MWITSVKKFLKRWEYQTTLSVSYENLYADQEATIRNRRETTDWFHNGKEVWKGCILSPCLFNLHAKYITWNARLDESHAGIKTSGRNINNLRYSDDTALIAESEEELESLLMIMKEEWKSSLKIKHSQKLRSWHLVPSLHSKIEGEKVEAEKNFTILGSQITVDSDCSHAIKMLAPWKKSYDKPRHYI